MFSVLNGFLMANGRRLRYFVFDQQNDKLIGIVGLADPVVVLHWPKTGENTCKAKLIESNGINLLKMN